MDKERLKKLIRSVEKCKEAFDELDLAHIEAGVAIEKFSQQARILKAPCDSVNFEGSQGWGI